MAAEFETYLVLDVLPGDKTVSAANHVHERLRTCLTQSVGADGYSGKSPVAKTRADLRVAMLDEINQISLDLLIRAKKGFETLQLAAVEYSINTNNKGEPPDFSRFDFKDFPFVSFHGDALAAALRIRNQRPNLQLVALRFAHGRSVMELFDMSLRSAEHFGHKVDSDFLIKHQEVQKLQQKLCMRLPKQIQDDVDEFYACVEVGSVHPYAIPIEIPMGATSEDLRFISQTLKGIGSTFSINFELRVEGSNTAVKNAQAGRLMYEAAGMGFQALSAWIMAVDTINDQPRCSVCYRHCSAISRCSVHATKKQETREARLGKRVRPHYEKRLLELSHVPAIKSRLSKDLSWSDEADDVTEAALRRLGLSLPASSRAIVLASQLRELVALMSSDIKCLAGALFQSILDVATSIEAQPPSVGDEARRFRERQLQALKELLSLKGFFKAWCGKGRYSPEINLNMLGFDRDHPVAKGSALVSTMVPRAFLELRAWTEATTEFKNSNLPTFNDVTLLLHTNQSKLQVAELLGISVSTVYKVLKRGRKQRKRHYLGRV